MIGPFRRRVPYVPQMEHTECGAASLTMILAYHGHHAPLVELRTACGVSRDGANALAIVEAARRYGLEAKGLKTSVAGLAELPLPAIVHWKLDHFVVLESIGPGEVQIVDPASGPRRLAVRELDESFTGIALTMTPGPTFRPRRRPPRAVSRYLGSARTAAAPLGVVLVASLLLEILGLLLPASHQVMLDTVVRPRQERLLWFVAIALGSALALRAALAAVRERVLAGLRMALDVELMTTFVDRLVRLPLDFFQQRSAGDLVTRVQSNAALREAITLVASASLDVVLVLAYAALMLAYDRPLGALVVGLSLLRVAVVGTTAQKSQELLARELVAGAREADAAFTAVTYPEPVRAFHVEPALVERHHAGAVDRLNVAVARRDLSDGALALLPLLDGAARMAVLWIGGNAVLEDRMTPGVFASFLAMQALLVRPLSALVSGYLQLQTLGRHLERMDDVLEAAPEPTGTQKVDELRGHVALDTVSFRYGPRGTMLVENVSLHAGPGEMIALVGPSGAGKTTLLKLLLGFVEPTEGRVLYDGVDLRTLDRRSVRRRLGLVSQDAYFFDDTVRANLKLWAPDATADQLWWALRVACIEDVVAALPGGLDGRLGPGARALSGGQRQRLALARALVHGPSVLLLDEATSSLDRAVEARVHANLQRMGCTRIVIAHRLRTVQDADRIYVLEGGRIAQVGTHASLVRAAGTYRRLQEALA